MPTYNVVATVRANKLHPEKVTVRHGMTLKDATAYVARNRLAKPTKDRKFRKGTKLATAHDVEVRRAD